MVLQAAKSPQLSPRKTIQDTVKSKHPQTVGQLAKIIMTDSSIDDTDLVVILKEMANDGTLVLQPPSYKIQSVWDYLFTLTLSGWLWASFSVVALALLAIVLIPDLFPLNTVRWVLGSIFVLCLPGYSLIQLLFPKGKELDSLERFALSIGLSLAVVPLVGLLLNFTPWGIRFAPITISLGSFTALALMAGAIRQYLEVRT